MVRFHYTVVVDVSKACLDAKAPNVGDDYMRLGSQVGLTAGLRVYSRAMENEADHLGPFILKQAGYGPKGASHSHVRLLNERKSVRHRSDKARLLYERIHSGITE